MITISGNLSSTVGAGRKAPNDIDKIIYDNFDIRKIKNIELNISKFQIINNIKKIYFILLAELMLLFLNKNEMYIMQTTFFQFFIKLKKINIFNAKILKNKKIVLFIHDINGIRNNNNQELDKEINLFKSISKLIVHNEAMKKFLVEKGIDENKIYILECFDYKCKEIDVTNDIIDNTDSKDSEFICYTGNLSKEKCPFVYQLDSNKMNFKIKLYGNGIDKDINNKVIYANKYNADILPNKIQGKLGLIWDGNLDESDEDYGFKNYTKYNNPHKLSCYIAAGLPVIVWRKAAIANFVKKYNIGYTISNIYDINNLDFSDYNEKLKNVQELKPKVRDGYFTKKVLNEILKDIEN